METLKIQFYKVPKRSKHKTSSRFRDHEQFTIEQLETAKSLIDLAIKCKS